MPEVLPDSHEKAETHPSENTFGRLCSHPLMEQKLTLENQTEDRVGEVSVIEVYRNITTNLSQLAISWNAVPNPNGGAVLYYEIKLSWHLEAGDPIPERVFLFPYSS